MEKKNRILFMIMAGGVGKRLRPYTYALPKPLLTANNISPLESCIKNIKKFYKSEKIYLAVCYKKKIFANWLKSKKIKNVQLLEEKNPLGTAGSVKKIIKKKFKNIVLINGDLFFKINFKNLVNFHNKKNCDVTVGITNNEIEIPYGVFSKKDNRFYFQEKPKVMNKINSGIYLFNKKFLKKFFLSRKNRNKNKFDIPELIKQVEKKNLGIFDIGKKWIDIGNIYDFKKASREIQNW